MAKFITGKDLEDVVYNIIWEAEDILLIVSPFIKLDEYFKKLFDKHVNNPKIHLLIVFGKNEGDVRKSLSKDDFDYFKKFLNITVVYVPNLHAKYYGNEKKGVITSINLYDYSFKNNIEFGVYSELNLLSNFTTNPDQEAWATCNQIAENNEAVFVKRPVFQKKILGKNYVKSDILHDITESFYRGKHKQGNTIKKLADFPEELELGSQSNVRPEREDVEKSDKNKITGYCIRTGVEIPFNPKQPYSKEAWKSWAYYSNWDFPEKYCHKTGKPSNGKTSMRNPIL